MLAAVLLMATTMVEAGEDLATIRSTFAAPPREFATGPLWVWNDQLTDAQVIGTLRDLAAQKVKQVFVHPRPGLMTPYLSEEWFRLWKLTLAEAERLDMNVWIYDENSYPSGFAGGLVPEALPDSRARSLVIKTEQASALPGENLVAVFRSNGDRFENITAAVQRGEKPAAGTCLTARLVPVPSTPWFGGKWYVDLLRPGVTDKFLEITLESYRKRFGNEFGKRLPGSFTDEPHLAANGNGFAWTDDLPAQFRARWNYDLVELLPNIVRNTGDWKRVRHNLMQTLSNLFVERWAKPYHDYCKKHNLQFTGHYWDHMWPACESVPDNMAMAAWQQTPGIDCLMNQYREDTNAQFGNLRFVRELASVANQLGQKRRLCEIYGAGGWDLRFEDMKRIGDWLGVLGVNLFDEHLSYVTIRGARKNDHPQSFSYHEPWWSDYHVMAQYMTRLSYAMSLGEQVNDVLILEPTTTAWMYQFPGEPAQKERLKQIGGQFFDLLLNLEHVQQPYDLGCEDIMERHGKIEVHSLRVGNRAYRTLVLPPLTENLNTRTAELIEAFLDAGGTVFSCDQPPSRIDGQASDRLAKTAAKPGWKTIAPGELAKALEPLRTEQTIVRRAADDKGNLFHQSRTGAFGELLLLVNTSIETESKGVIETRAPAAERWDLETGAISPYPVETGEKTKIAFTLPPCGSLLLRLGPSSKAPAAPAPKQVATLPASGPAEVRRIEPNVLVLDYVDLTTGGQTTKEQYYYAAAQKAFSANGMERNPWDSAVQFRDELVQKKFPPGSGFEVAYRFTIASRVPEVLELVIERPDLYTITCNHKPVQAAPNSWWLDRSFGRINLSGVATTGENVVLLKAAPMTIFHEIERAYVLGSFRLRPAEKGFVIVPDEPLEIKPEGWNQQGHPFYAAGVSYSQPFQVTKLGGRFEVALPSWYGSVARVMVNGKEAGHIYHQPYACDVTAHVREGANRIEVQVVGTLKNLLGPHHGSQPLGTAWPAMFRNGPAQPPPGNAYGTVAYGLMESIVFRQLQ